MQVFRIAPAGLGPFWVLAAVAGVTLAVLAVLAVSLVGSRWSRFELSASGLRIRGDLYGRLLPAQSLRAAEARRVDLATTSELRPRLRTWGTGLPGYQSGWFRLANGEKALVYLTDRQRAVYVPTHEGYSLLLSPEEPDAFLNALRTIAR